MEILNSDQLMLLSESDLKNLFLSLRSMIKENESYHEDDASNQTKVLETYYCYVYRELEHRRVI